MTHLGGKPHAVGDQGQRYEVTFLDHDADQRRVLGWTDDHSVALRMVSGVNAHPTWNFPWVVDRKPE